MNTGLCVKTALAGGLVAMGVATAEPVAGAAGPVQGGIKIVKNGRFSESPDLGFRYQDLEEPLLAQLARRENLAKRAGSGPREFDQIVRMREWVADQWKPGSPDPYPPWNALTILDWIRSKKTSGHCGQYSQVLLQSLAALGHTARYVELGSRENPYAHFAVEVWSNDFNKWVVMDADYNLHFERHGVPLNTLEVHDALVSMRLAEVFLKRSQLRRGYSDPTRWPNGTAELYYYIRFHLKADHLSKPDEPPFDRLNDMVEWVDKRTVAWESGIQRTEFPREQLTTKKTLDRAAVEAPINQVHVTAVSDDQGVLLTLRHNVRHYRNYEYRITTGERRGEWQRHTDNAIRVPHSAVKRQIEIRGVNVRGVAGPASVVEID